MAIFHMETEQVRSVATQLARASDQIQAEMEAAFLAAVNANWMGPSRDQFVEELSRIVLETKRGVLAGEALASRGEKEIQEWEMAGAALEGSEDGSIFGLALLIGIILAPLLSPPKVYAPSPRGNTITGAPSNLENFYEPQEGNTCGFQATRNILAAFGVDASIADLQRRAGYEPGKEGTLYEDYEEMFSAYNVPVDSHEGFATADDAQKMFLDDLKAGKAILARIDVESLDTYWGNQSGGHALWVTGVRTDENGQITHIICNDSGLSSDNYTNGTWELSGTMKQGSDGVPDGQGIEYPAYEFMEAWSYREYSYIATQNPIPDNKSI